jgi:hypothetical protein
MRANNLSNAIKVTKVAAGAASGGTDVAGTTIDMQGFEGVVFVTTIATANAGNFLKAQQGVASDLSDAADLEGSKVVAAANGQVVWYDLYQPRERYVRPVVVRAGANTATGDLYAIQYGPRRLPVSNLVANTIIGEVAVSPAEGTA